MTNYLNDLIHVKAYTKDDGTNVKEHWRGHGSAGSGMGIMDPREGGPVFSDPGSEPVDYNSAPPKNLFDLLLSVLNPNGVIAAADGNDDGDVILTGRVEKTEGEDDQDFPDDNDDWDEAPENTPNAFGDIFASVVAQAIKNAIDLHAENQKSNSSKNIDQQKIQLDTSIKTIDLTQNALKTTMDKTMDDLIKTKNQNEYEKLFQTHSQLEETLQQK